MGMWEQTSAGSALSFLHGTRTTFPVAGAAMRRAHVTKSWAATHLALPRLVTWRVPPWSADAHPPDTASQLCVMLPRMLPQSQGASGT